MIIEKQDIIESEKGKIFYKYLKHTDKFKTIRVISQDGENVSVIDLDTHNITDITVTILRTEYVEVLSDIDLNLYLVKIADSVDSNPIYDIIITDNIYKPTIVCRQNMKDIVFDNYARTNCIDTNNYEMVGYTITKQSPVLRDIELGVDISDLTYYSEIILHDKISWYKFDTLEDIMSFFDKSILEKVNFVLDSIYNSRLSYYTKEDPSKDKEDKILDGYCNNLKYLLITNNFMYDLRGLFGIIKVEFKLNRNDKVLFRLHEDERKIISSLFGIRMNATLCTMYDMSIDLDHVPLINYVLVMDATNTLYIIRYNTNPKEVIPVYKETPSDDNIIAEKLRNAVDMYNKYAN